MSRVENGLFDYPQIHEAPHGIRDAFQRTQDVRKGMLIAMFLLLGAYHVGFDTSRWKRTPGKWAAQFLFCKFVEHQTEGGFWFSMLR